MTFGGLVTPPVSPEEELCPVESNRLPVSTCFTRPPPNFLTSSDAPFFTGTPSTIQSNPYANNPPVTPYPFSVPIHHQSYYTYHNTQSLLTSKVKVEPGFSTSEVVSTPQINQIHVPREIPSYQTNFQIPNSSHFHAHHNWVNEEKAVINNTSSTINGPTTEAYSKVLTLFRFILYKNQQIVSSG